MEPREELPTDFLAQLNDGSRKWLSDCTPDDMASLDAWHKRRYTRALATRRKVRDGRWDLLTCDYLMPGGEFCEESPCWVQPAGPVGEPYALCDGHSAASLDEDEI